MSEETRKKISEAKKGHLKGTKQSPEQIAKRMESRRNGGGWNKETGKKISQSLKGNIPWNKGKKVGPMSEEQKQARSITMTGQKKTKSHATNVANAVLGNISINKDNTEKKVKKDTLQSYLDDGWQLGGKKRKIA